MEIANKFSSGNKGVKIRSDCFISLELKGEGGIEINLSSKVNSIYGNHIRRLCGEILDFFEVKHVVLTVEDSGALDFVIAARLEAVIKQAICTDNEFLLELISENKSASSKIQSRVTRLYLPGNTPSLMINSGIHKPDGIILDLEDAVVFSKKEEARFLVRNALRNLDFLGAERMVRINQLPEGLRDLSFVVPHNVNLILIPKCEEGTQVKLIEDHIKKIQEEYKLIHPIWLMPIIESAKGILNIAEIARASDKISGIAIGLEDYTSDIGVERTNLGMETLYARMQIITTCKALGIQPIDSVFSDIEDLEALKKNVQSSKSIGFEGMGCIHPRQIEIISENFAPSEDELEQAKKIVAAYETAVENGLGVVSLGTKMIDAPVVEKARRIIEQAIMLNKLKKHWVG